MKLRGVTVDTGFLVALERSKQRAIELTALAGTRGIRLTLPVAVLAEWWRDGKRQGHYLRAFAIEHMTDRLARSAGEAHVRCLGLFCKRAVQRLPSGPRIHVQSHPRVPHMYR